jgi:uncharacterized phage infection (PIP) family protein YhgE
MKEQNKGYVSHVDNQRKEFEYRLNELQAQHKKIADELNDLRAKTDNLLEINSQQIAVCDRFIEEAGDDAEACHYLKTFKATLVMTRMSLKALQEEVNRR